MTLEQISEQLQAGKAKIVKELVQQAIDQGYTPQDILEKGLLHGMSALAKSSKRTRYSYLKFWLPPVP